MAGAFAVATFTLDAARREAAASPGRVGEALGGIGPGYGSGRVAAEARITEGLCRRPACWERIVGNPLACSRAEAAQVELPLGSGVDVSGCVHEPDFPLVSADDIADVGIRHSGVAHCDYVCGDVG